MKDHPGVWLQEQPEGRRVLAAYAASEAELPSAPRSGCTRPAESTAGVELAAAETHETWVPRLPSVDGVSAERLPALHGKLIALGLLRFELFGRSHGMRYRLSPEGRSLIARLDRGEELAAGDDDELLNGDAATSIEAA